MASLCSSSFILLVSVFLFTLTFSSRSSSEYEYERPIVFSIIPHEEVNVSLYYETLCPGSQGYIINNLSKLFRLDVIQIVKFRFIPFGNAKIQPNNTVSCQHGEDECYLNTIHACAIDAWPDFNYHFKFIECVEKEISTKDSHKWEEQWKYCARQVKMNETTIQECYDSGKGKELELKHGKETLSLNPPKEFVPWVTVNGLPLREDFGSLIKYICKAYRGSRVPKTCKEVPPKTKDADAADTNLLC